MRKLRPNAIKEVVPHVIGSPYGIDLITTSLQNSFADKLEWLEKAFGRAVIMSERRDDAEYLYPGMFIAEGYDYMNMLELDNWGAYCFFIAKDPERPVEYEEGADVVYERPVDCIFWMNLQRVDKKRKDDFLEELKMEILEAIEDTTFMVTSGDSHGVGVEVLNVYDDPRNVFDQFNYPVTDRQNLYYPYRGLRIEMNGLYVKGKCLS